MVVAAGNNVERVLRIVEKAHHECYIANSVTSEIVIEPAVELA
jgi:organic hydroperoxide reductase OsmC/OhrA